MNREQFTPSPEVLHLTTLFRRIQSGEIRIPAFQRKFVWQESDILKLFESVYRGYPIGSLLLWKVNEKLLKIEEGDTSPFPKVEERYPISFVLDGVQRLSTLYGALHLEDISTESHLNVIFDLRNEEFLHFDPEELPDAYIHLSDLFSPRRLIKAQQALTDLYNGDDLLEKTINLHAAFQEYMVPVVTITRREVAEVVEIFERVNSSGLTLGTVDFMRAATWSEQFDLANELTKLERRFADLGYPLRQETLVKLLAVALNKDPTPDEMIKLRTHSARELHKGIKLAEKATQKAIEFLKKEVYVLSSSFLPYEAQLLVLAKIFLDNHQPDNSLLSKARSWFWSVSFSETFRGKPDHYVVRAIRNAELLAKKQTSAFDNRLSFSVQDTLERRTTRGTALTSAFCTLFAANKAQSLTTGELIPPEEFLQEYSSSSFHHLIPRVTLAELASTQNIPASCMANTILIRSSENKAIGGATTLGLLRHTTEHLKGRSEAVLLSQFITTQSLQFLERKDYLSFLMARAIRIFDAVEALASDKRTSPQRT